MKPATRFMLPALFVVSAVAIAYQIVLMRVWSIAQWHHFAYMIISVAMLGFGAAGTILTLLREPLRGREAAGFRYSMLAFMVSLPLCYIAVQQIPFETFHLITQGDQWGWLFLLYLLMAIPFVLASACTTFALFLWPDRVGRVYAIDLLGSGSGAALIVGLLFWFSPAQLAYGLAIPVGIMALLQIMDGSRRYQVLAVILIMAGAISVAVQGIVPIHVSDYKVLSYTLQFPDAKVVAVRHSPLSEATLVTSRQIRETPGQLGNYPFAEAGLLPEQAGIFFDGGAVSVVNRFDGDLSRLRFLEHVPPSVAYRVVRNPEVLVIGAGGGTDVLMALYHGAPEVTAAEVDPSVWPLIDAELATFSGYLYERPDVRTVLAEGRGLLRREGRRYDVIQIALLDAFNAAASGVYALSESYLYTREAIQLYYEHLKPGGVLSVTRWLKTPPRDAIKMLATYIEALEASGVEKPGDHIAFIRSWNAATLLLSRDPWTDEQIDAIRDFAATRHFDIDWIPGLQADEVNQFTILETPIYFEAALALLSPEREQFYRDYLFQVRPANDDRPHFFQFFKLDTLPRLIREMGHTWVPFVEWGYIALWATILQGVLASVLLIVVPAIVLHRRAATGGRGRWVLAYFCALGLAFMFLEIAFIQKLMLFLTYPIYAVAVVLASFLIFSGIGSLAADTLLRRYSSNGVWFILPLIAVLLIGVLAVFYTLTLPTIFDALAGAPDVVRISLSLLLVAPLAFCMGIPLPCGLQCVSRHFPAMVPWAWAINGVASVLGAALATLLAIHMGFRQLVWYAALIYVASLYAYWALSRNQTNAS